MNLLLLVAILGCFAAAHGANKTALYPHGLSSLLDSKSFPSVSYSFNYVSINGTGVCGGYIDQAAFVSFEDGPIVLLIQCFEAPLTIVSVAQSLAKFPVTIRSGASRIILERGNENPQTVSLGYQHFQIIGKISTEEIARMIILNFPFAQYISATPTFGDALMKDTCVPSPTARASLADAYAEGLILYIYLNPNGHTKHFPAQFDCWTHQREVIASSYAPPHQFDGTQFILSNALKSTFSYPDTFKVAASPLYLIPGTAGYSICFREATDGLAVNCFNGYTGKAELNTDPYYQWRFVPAGGKYWTIVNVKSEACLTSRYQDTLGVVANCTGLASEKWEVIKLA